MRKLMTTLMLVILGTGLVQADHDDGPGRYATPGYGYGGNDDIARAAHQMEYAAERFHQQLRHSTRRDHVTDDAKRLAREAREFHREVEKGRSYRRMRDDYADLARAFDHARREYRVQFDWRHGRFFGADFGPVERAFAHLNRAVYIADRGHAGYRDRDRYAWGRDGYGWRDWDDDD